MVLAAPYDHVLAPGRDCDFAVSALCIGVGCIVWAILVAELSRDFAAGLVERLLFENVKGAL
jgi:hypothetical protein